MTMKHRPFIGSSPCIVWLALLVAPFALIACSAKSAEPAAEEVDPRFASAEALVEYYNSLTTKAPVQIEQLLDLTYGETEVQKQFVSVAKDFITVGKLMKEAATRFNTKVDDNAFATETAAVEPANITQNTGDRAQATYKNEHGREETLYLVKIGARWWVSGYTVEYDPKMTDLSESVVVMQAISNVMVKIMPDMRTRLNKGDFKSMKDFQTGYQLAIAGYAMQHPDEFQQLRGMDPARLARVFGK